MTLKEKLEQYGFPLDHCKERYNNIIYHGLVDDYVFFNINEGFEHIQPFPLYNGIKYQNTISLITIKNALKLENRLE